jgi:hypothetical protein
MEEVFSIEVWAKGKFKLFLTWLSRLIIYVRYFYEMLVVELNSQIQNTLNFRDELLCILSKKRKKERIGEDCVQ